MQIKANFSELKRTAWSDFAVRFCLGGAITVWAGLIAKRFGPSIGGLFLAFPAIFPASATLIEKHEKRKKLRAGIQNTRRGRQAAALDARGAALGSAGLVCFAILLWKALALLNAALTLILGLAMWLGASVLIWRFRK
jgi:hypothetical protein